MDFKAGQLNSARDEMKKMAKLFSSFSLQSSSMSSLFFCTIALRTDIMMFNAKCNNLLATATPMLEMIHLDRFFLGLYILCILCLLALLHCSYTKPCSASISFTSLKNPNYSKLMFSICVDLCNKWETGKWPSCNRNKRCLA